MTRVLVIGSGGREHALAWALAGSGAEIVCAPGNGGTAALGRNVALDVTDAAAVVRLGVETAPDLVVIGPDAAVAAGVADACAAAGLRVFGPSAAAGRVESSKRFAKQLMRDAGIPTATAVTVDRDTRDAGVGFITEHRGRVAVKADGLALGKGVTVHDDAGDAVAALDAALLQRRFGDAGDVVVVEERLSGREVSVFALSDGVRVRMLAPACDYKRAFDGDAGPNTGGMGAYTPPLDLDPAALLDEVRARVVEPCIAELSARGTPYRGCLYAGLMLTPDGMRVLEFNARFGDPEAQVVLPMLAEDPLGLLTACATGDLAPGTAATRGGACVAVVAAARNYPEPSPPGLEISGTGALDGDVLCFHAGTAVDAGGVLRTAGGRVLAVVGRGTGVDAARRRAYTNLERIHFDGMRYRNDIALPLQVPA